MRGNHIPMALIRVWKINVSMPIHYLVERDLRMREDAHLVWTYMMEIPDTVAMSGEDTSTNTQGGPSTISSLSCQYMNWTKTVIFQFPPEWLRSYSRWEYKVFTHHNNSLQWCWWWLGGGGYTYGKLNTVLVWAGSVLFQNNDPFLGHTLVRS